MVKGGCNCGDIRYELSDKPLAIAQCHCRNCQRQSGSAFSVNLVLKRDAVSHVGELSAYEDRDTYSGTPVMRRFCGRCGSPVLSEQDDGKGLIIVKAGTLDDPGQFAPSVSIWTCQALPWVILSEEVHKFERNP